MVSSWTWRRHVSTSLTEHSTPGSVAYLITCVKQEAANGRKYNAKGKEERQDGLRCKNRPVVIVSVSKLVVYRRSRRLTARPLIAVAGKLYLSGNESELDPSPIIRATRTCWSSALSLLWSI